MTWVTVSDVAERYNRTERQVRAAIDRGVLPANRPPGAKSYRILAGDAEALFGTAAVHTPPPRDVTRESPTARSLRQLREAGIG